MVALINLDYNIISQEVTKQEIQGLKYHIIFDDDHELNPIAEEEEDDGKPDKSLINDINHSNVKDFISGVRSQEFLAITRYSRLV